MSYLYWAIPVALFMGGVALAAFMWSLRKGQYDDLDGAAERVLLDDDCDEPLAAGSRVGADKRKRNGRRPDARAD